MKRTNGRTYLGRVLSSLLGLALAQAVHASDPSSLFDFDGDEKTDISVYREGSVVMGQPRGQSYFYYLSSKTSELVTVPWGLGLDIGAPADYDGDGIADPAIFRWWDDELKYPWEASHYWIDYSSSGDSPIYYNGFGLLQARNYFGGAAAEPAIYKMYDVNQDPKDPCWIYAYHILYSAVSYQKDVVNSCSVNGPGAPQAATGDYNGDGESDVAILLWSPSSPTDGSFAVWYSPIDAEYTSPDATQALNVDFPIPGDYDGDGTTDFAGGKIDNGYLHWRIKKSSNGNVVYIQWGVTGDKPVPGDYDGDGKTDLAVFRPSNTYWYIWKSSDSNVISQQFGYATDKPVPQPNVFSY